ncbi:Ail/Lom family outer membrane beta-barrel protein [Acinetobacter shaoyimingii]|uniref:Ail/Lom family outer membrane beta-barrel protein n=1 Tax=Acinetobacter shaoyimingii TaxID=2715164 RepID=A0A6G8RWQ4_9GAMM|nr:Ail/Lom family outer membrane beta-barrel protein [Acinetobacter shaoyimingii]NHB57102.1 Ail/Lom family outer membrane beta-barrel protein [Acinetobacter shaoyimingii]QIO06280.1 Ail/Lom family outer membrane beta-barrel protein [Acinetobacter shaoyimingii]
MKEKILKTILLAAVSFAATQVFAESHTISVGYGQTSIEKGLNPKGVNVQYRYELDSPVGIVASASYLQGEQRFLYGYGYEDWNVNYYSFLAGPSFRFNKVLSVYALGGLVHGRAHYFDNEKDYKWTNHYHIKDTAFAYGGGLIINPTKNLSVNAGYEATRLRDKSFEGFNVGVGYRF